MKKRRSEEQIIRILREAEAQEVLSACVIGVHRYRLTYAIEPGPVD